MTRSFSCRSSLKHRPACTPFFSFTTFPSCKVSRVFKNAVFNGPQRSVGFTIGAGGTTSDASNEDSLLIPYKGAALPIRMNTIPHSRELRRHFYDEAASAVVDALAEKTHQHLRISVRCTIPELNPEFDVYRIGTLLELVRSIATAIVRSGSGDQRDFQKSRRVKVCVQQSLGQGVFQGTPLALSGVMRIMNQMDWGSEEVADHITTGNLGAKEVEKNDADAFILIAPQNMTGQSVLPLLQEMVTAAEVNNKPIVLINAKLGDIPSSAGVMGIRGRSERQDFVSTFITAYHFRLLYLGIGPYPIMGALRYRWGGPWQVFRRVDFIDGFGERSECYLKIGDFDHQPDASEITACFKKPVEQRSNAS